MARFKVRIASSNRLCRWIPLPDGAECHYSSYRATLLSQPNAGASWSWPCFKGISESRRLDINIGWVSFNTSMNDFAFGRFPEGKSIPLFNSSWGIPPSFFSRFLIAFDGPFGIPGQGAKEANIAPIKPGDHEDGKVLFKGLSKKMKFPSKGLRYERQRKNPMTIKRKLIKV